MAEAVVTGGECGSAPPDMTDSFPSEEYECTICYNYFDLGRHTPKLLACSHTFCHECLDALHLRGGRGWRIGCPVKNHEPLDSSFTDVQTGSAAYSATSQESNASCQTCKQVAFMTGCVCAIFSFMSMLVLLFLGLIFVHNFNHTSWPVGPLCLFVASVLAPFSLILTWLMCMLKFRPETQDSRFLTSNVM